MPLHPYVKIVIARISRMPFDVEIVDHRERRALANGLDYGFDGPFLSFKLHFDAPVRKVSHASAHMTPPRFVTNKGPVVDPLYQTVDPNMSTNSL